MPLPVPGMRMGVELGERFLGECALGWAAMATRVSLKVEGYEEKCGCGTNVPYFYP